MLELDDLAPSLADHRLAAGWAHYAQRIAAPGTIRRPDFLIIGPPKTATTWLYANLVDEPDLSLPLQKESKYFSQNWRLFDFASYAALIDSRGTGLLGEASPDYFCLPDGVLDAIAATLPALKIIVLLRQPVERLWSHLKHQKRFSEGLYAADAAAHPLAAAQHPVAFAHLDYAGCLARWHKRFPREQVFVGFMEDIETDPQGFLARVKRFLGGVPMMPRDFESLIERVNAGSPERPPHDLSDALAQISRPHLNAAIEVLSGAFGLEAPMTWMMERDRKFAVAPLPAPDYRALDARLFGRDGRSWISPGAIFDHQAVTEKPDWFSVQGDWALVRYRGWLYGLPRPEQGPVKRVDLERANRAGQLKRATSLSEFEAMV